MFDKLAGLVGIGKGYGNALNQNNQLMQMMGAINKPYRIDKNEYQDVQFVDPKYAGDLEAELQGETAFNDISDDPAVRNAQLQALSEMEQLADKGITLQDEANQRKFINRANTEARANREAIDQNMQARGLGGSGLAYTSKLMADQEASNRLAEQGTDLASANADRRFNAIQGLGDMSGSVRGQDYQIASNKAGANDAVNNYNTNLKNQINQVNNSNQQTWNNNVANTRNDQTRYNRDNKLKIEGINAGSVSNANNTTTSGLTSLAGSNANLQVGRDQAIGNFAGSLLSGGGMLAGGMMTKSDKRVKKDISKLKPSEALRELTGHKFKYKDSFDDGNDHVGFMAQDFEKVIPSAVSNDEDGFKSIDYGNPEVQAIQLSAISELLNKIDKIEKKVA
ncbi:tail fiber domain-containing protein [Leptospira bandrabouensis]|uniref:Tail fiber domain-containing protein n=1 Tax=Leptospira bandrabouensis TaxID=2484903 RepID=A0A6H3NLW3_9LEPT|nr:tail fiber domain-containing protein [Leptospira bandrabouensis]TGN09986.1 tail fiber domain-containing protein [Leptospira bandrabouensis]TGN12356.1 tail fiber domain-containing protein [Leptospira bandrabouensis]